MYYRRTTGRSNDWLFAMSNGPYFVQFLLRPASPPCRAVHRTDYYPAANPTPRRTLHIPLLHPGTSVIISWRLNIAEGECVYRSSERTGERRARRMLGREAVLPLLQACMFARLYAKWFWVRPVRVGRMFCPAVLAVQCTPPQCGENRCDHHCRPVPHLELIL